MIDLAEYTPGIMKFIKSRKLYAICVFGCEGESPSKIICTFDPSLRWSGLQRNNPHRITIEHLVWMSSVVEAHIVVEETKRYCHHKQLRGEWFDIDPFEFIVGLEQVLHKYFPRTEIVDHSEIIDTFRLSGLATGTDRRRRGT